MATEKKERSGWRLSIVSDTSWRVDPDRKIRGTRVAWVIDFLFDTDLDRMGREELGKTSVDLNRNLSPLAFFPILDGERFPPVMARRFGLSQVGEKAQAVLREMLQRVQGALRNHFATYIEPVLLGDQQSAEFLSPEQRIRRFSRLGGALSIAPVTKGEGFETLAVESFTRLLTDPPLPLAAFQKCEGCNRWFFSFRSKRFCRPHCNWRVNSRKARGERRERRSRA